MTEPLFLVHDGKAHPIRLGRLLGEGAVGKVFAVEGQPELAVKLYHNLDEARDIEPKIEMMLANPPDLPAIARNGADYPQIAWPSARIIDRQNRFRGFAMPAIDLQHSTSLVNLLQKSSRRAEGLSDYYGYRVMVAYNLAAMFAELHHAGHHMIDMKPANLRIYPETSWIAVVDTDGFSIAANGKRIPAGQVSDDYIAPESWKKASTDLGERQDLFALAVIIFQLLNNGAHPFSGRAVEGEGPLPTDIQTRILEGLYAYGSTPHAKVLPASVSLHKTFRRETRQLFDRAFLPGHRRPKAEAWQDHLAKLIDLLTPCKAKPAEHAHFGMGCGFCLYEAQVAAVVASAKARPRPIPKRMPHGLPMRRPAPYTRPMRNGPQTRKSNGKSKPSSRKKNYIRARQRQRFKSSLFTAIAAGTVLGGLMITGLITEQLVEGLASPRAIASSGADRDNTAEIDKLQPFPIPVKYRLIPDRSGAGDSLRLGPGTQFDTADTVGANERVTGLAESKDTYGKRWIWVKLNSGGSGYLRAKRLALAPELFDDDQRPPSLSTTPLPDPAAPLPAPLTRDPLPRQADLDSDPAIAAAPDLQRITMPTDTGTSVQEKNAVQ